MFQVAQSSAGTVVIGVPLDGNGKSLYDNDDSLFYYNSSWRSCPANQLLLLTLANGSTQYADSAGTCSVDECGNVTWNYTANDTATLGNASVSVYYAPGAYPATYSMQPQVMQVGPLLSDSTPWLQLARVHISGVATPSDMNFQDFLLATNPPALAVIQAAFTELNIGPDDPLKPQCWLSANGEYAIVWDGLNGYVTNLAGTVVYFVGTGPEGSVLGPYDAQSGTGTEVSVAATGTTADLSATVVATAASPILSLLTLQFAIQYGLPYQFVANTAYGVMQPAGPYRTGSAIYNGWAAVWQTVGQSKYLYWDYEDTGNWYLGPDTVPAHATYYNGNNDPTGGTWLEVATNQPGEYPIVLTAMTLPTDGSIKADAAAAIAAAGLATPAQLSALQSYVVNAGNFTGAFTSAVLTNVPTLAAIKGAIIGGDGTPVATAGGKVTAVLTNPQSDWLGTLAADFVADAAAGTTALNNVNIPAGVAAMLIASGLAQYIPPATSGPLQWTAAALALGAGSGLTAQQTRDAMKLAPSAGAPAAGSIDALLDAIPGVSSNARTITVTCTDTSGNPVAGAMVWTSSSGSDPTAMTSNGAAITDAAGVATVLTLVGTQYVWRMKAGTQFANNPSKITVT